MKALEPTINAVMMLIAAYLVLTQWQGANEIIKSGGGFITQSIGLLQGRPIRGTSFTGNVQYA